MQRGHFWRGDNNESTGGIWYTTTGGVPAFVTIQAPASGWQDNLNYNLGIFAQDRWTVDRLTLSGGVRVDLQNESTEPFTAVPHRWVPGRNFSFAAVKDAPNWKDINPRASVAYDLFGNGRTALKASASRGVEQDSIRYARANNPATTIQTQTQRVWEDDDADFVPDCNLGSGLAQGTARAGGPADGIDFCGPWQTPTFGTAVPGTRYDPSIMEGWGVRPWNWEFSAGVQQQIVPRLSASFGYFRRVYGNFFVTDNEALARTDFTQYSVTVPDDPRLPNARQTIGGLYDQNAIVANQNVVKDASAFGKQLQHWDGIDLSIDARLRNGLFLQGGLSTGKTMTDNCDIVDDLPEALQGTAQTGVPSPVVSTAGVWTPASYCHQETPFLSQYKAVASYTLPWYGVRLSGTFQSIPGPVVVANNIFNNTNRVALTTLARPFTLGQANVNVIEPASFYGDRLNQFDLRFTKIVNVGRGRVDLNVDLYNAFNSDAIISEFATFGGLWRLPTSVIQPRFVKFAARWDF